MSMLKKGTKYSIASLKNMKKMGIRFVFYQTSAKFLPHLLPQKLKFISEKISQKNYANISNYLTANYSYIISKYKKLAFNSRPYVKSGQALDNIWIIWLQGMKNAPTLVKKCIASVYKNNKTKMIHVLTEKNLSNYIEIPRYILEKYEANIIGPANFSDICRSMLLSKYGGIWIDATIFCTRKIPDEITKSYFFSIKRKPQRYSMSIANSRWHTFFMLSQPNSLLFCYIRDFLLEYWKKENKAIDYLLIDYIIEVGISQIPEIEEIIGNVEYSNKNIFYLEKNFNQKLDSKIINHLFLDNTFLYKLSNRDKHHTRTWLGEATVYKFFLDHL